MIVVYSGLFVCWSKPKAIFISSVLQVDFHIVMLKVTVLHSAAIHLSLIFFAPEQYFEE